MTPPITLCNTCYAFLVLDIYYKVVYYNRCKEVIKMNKFVDYLMMGLLTTVLVIVAYFWITLLIVYLSCIL